MSQELLLAHSVGGRAIDGATSVFQTNPSKPDDLIVRAPMADAALVGEAIAAAHSAQRVWIEMGAEVRSDCIEAIARELERRGGALAALMARETGKTIRDSRAEVARAIRIARFYAAEAIRNVGETFDSVRPGADVRVAYRPRGVVGLITPWNFPVAIPAWKIAPALCYGNGVVWKPSELSSATAAVLMEAIEAAKLPAGLVNLVLGAGATGAALAESEHVDGVSFTGSQSAGRQVRLACAKTGADVQLEMGGVNGLIVADDADIALAGEIAVNGAFFAAGQRCTATSRLIVMDAVFEAFLDEVKRRVSALTIGDASDEKSDIGPLVSEAQKRKATQTMLRSGGSVLFGGAGEGSGAFQAPTLVATDDAQDALLTEEVFAPVAAIMRVAGFEDAMGALNTTRLGLSAGLVTRSLSRAAFFERNAGAGMNMINLATAGVDYHAPFGGAGTSSYGAREQGRAARAFYARSVTTYVNAGAATS